MAAKLLRGRILTYKSEPLGPDDADAFDYFEDGAVLVEAGLIQAVGEHADVAPRSAGAEIVDHRPHLLMAGFIDPHIHFPQTQVIASWGAQLLDWLNDYTFPEESRYADPELASRMAGKFYDQLIAHGTTTA